VWYSFELRSSFGLLVRSLSPSPLIPGRGRIWVGGSPNLNRLKRKDVEFTLARHHGNSGLFSVLEIYVYLLFYLLFTCLFDIHFDLVGITCYCWGGFSLNSRGGFFHEETFFIGSQFCWEVGELSYSVY